MTPENELTTKLNELLDRAAVSLAADEQEEFKNTFGRIVAAKVARELSKEPS